MEEEKTQEKEPEKKQRRKGSGERSRREVEPGVRCEGGGRERPGSETGAREQRAVRREIQRAVQSATGRRCGGKGRGRQGAGRGQVDEGHTGSRGEQAGGAVCPRPGAALPGAQQLVWCRC